LYTNHAKLPKIPGKEEDKPVQRYLENQISKGSWS